MSRVWDDLSPAEKQYVVNAFLEGLLMSDNVRVAAITEAPQKLSKLLAAALLQAKHCCYAAENVGATDLVIPSAVAPVMEEPDQIMCCSDEDCEYKWHPTLEWNSALECPRCGSSDIGGISADDEHWDARFAALRLAYLFADGKWQRREMMTAEQHAHALGLGELKSLTPQSEVSHKDTISCPFCAATYVNRLDSRLLKASCTICEGSGERAATAHALVNAWLNQICSTEDLESALHLRGLLKDGPLLREASYVSRRLRHERRMAERRADPSQSTTP